MKIFNKEEKKQVIDNQGNENGISVSNDATTSVIINQSAKVDDKVTVISDASVVTGELVVKGDLIVCGKMDGKLQCDGEVRVSETGKIVGDLLAMSLKVAGHVEGTIECGKLHLFSTGKVLGQTATDTFVIDSGGLFEGESKRRTTDNVTQLKRNAS